MGSIWLGNVLGSEGNLVLLFLDQIARGGPVTVTDPDVECYFPIMEETVQRVLACAASCLGDGAIAIPVTGTPIRIVDLAWYLIEQASAKDLEITYTGLRPGDKLQEQFVFEREAVLGSRVDGVRWIDSPGVPEAELAAGLAELNTVWMTPTSRSFSRSSRAWCRSTRPAHFYSSQPAFPWLIK